MKEWDESDNRDLAFSTPNNYMREQILFEIANELLTLNLATAAHRSGPKRWQVHEEPGSTPAATSS